MANDVKQPKNIIPIAAGYEVEAPPPGVGSRGRPDMRPVVAVAEYAEGVYKACIINMDGILVFAPGVVRRQQQ